MDCRRGIVVSVAALMVAVAGAPLVMAQEPGSTTAGPLSVQIYFYGRPCLGEKVQFAANAASNTAASSSNYTYLWSVSGPSFDHPLMGDGPSISVIVNVTGDHTAFVEVKDPRTGASGRNATTIVFYRCEDTAASPSPTYQTGCYDASTGKYYECPSPSPATTYPVERCESLRREQNAYYADWKYRYNASTSDEERARLEMERRSFEEGWQQRWHESGCDYGGFSSECQSRWERARAALEQAQANFQSMWKQYFMDLEAARNEFRASGYHTPEEWSAFEAHWKARAAEIAEHQAQTMRQLAQEYLLTECGFHPESYAFKPAGEPIFAQPPPTADAYSELRAACEQRMIEVKSRYEAEFRSLYERLHAAPVDSPEYAEVRMLLHELEGRVAAEMEAIVHECREDYTAEYERPETFRDGIGSLQCYFDEASGRIQCDGKYVGFQGNPETQALYRYTCGGQLFFDELYANRVFEDFRFSQGEEGSSLMIRSENLKLIFHDGPRGVINVGLVGGAELYFVPSTYLDVAVDGHKVLLSGADARGVWVGGEDALSWDDVTRTLTIRGEATWIAETCHPDGSKPDGEHDSAYWNAIEKRRLGAQVVVTLDGDRAAQDNESYSDVTVRVRHEGGRKFLATIDSEEGTCKTVVLKFNSGIFETIRLRVSIVDEDGTALTVQEAASLEDVLEPCDDGENGFEYWIVQDRHGTQVIVSFAHFSEKRVSVEAASLGNVVVPGLGFEGAALAVGLAAAGAVVARRRLTR